MKKIVMLTLMSLIVTLSFGATLKKNFNFNNFNEIKASNTFDVKVIKSNTYKVEIEYSEEFKNYLKVREEGGKLILEINTNLMSNSLSRHMSDYTLKATVYMPSLEGLDFSGATKFYTDDTFQVKDFEADFSGASHLTKLNITGEKGEFDFSGATKGHLYGSLSEANYTISGASNVVVMQNNSEVEIDISGASLIDFDGNCSDVKIDCSGASNVTLNGKSASIEIDCSGASRIMASKMVSQTVQAEASGASNIVVNVEKKLIVDLSGSSSLDYYSAPNIVMDVISISKGSSLNKR